MYDENIFYRWTYKEWLNRVQGAKLATIDAQELAVQAAYVGAIVSREKKPKSPDKYFNANQARQDVLDGVSKPAKKADFTIYNKLKESMKDFNWESAYSVKSKK